MVNPSTELAIEIAKAVLQVGATDVVVCPGSRSAPLSWQFAALAKDKRIKLHTRIDEREAGFLALGLAKATRRPVPVVVTSGTAVANLLPAVVEAHHSGVPLVVISADRPAKVRGKSAPQTTLQVGIFDNFVKGAVDTDVPTQSILDTLRNSISNHFGPVHINAQFDMPLMPEETHQIFPEVDLQIPDQFVHAQSELELPPRGVLVVGDAVPGQYINQLSELAKSAGYPIIWEPTSQLHTCDNAISHGALLLQTQRTLEPEVVISAGLVGLSRSVLGLLKSAKKHIAIQLPDLGADTPDPVLSAELILESVPKVKTQIDSSWLAAWQKLDQQASEVVNRNIAPQTLTGPSAAVEVWNHIPENSQLVISPSWPVRHLEMYASTRAGLTTYGNRGVNGIDGLISTAVGISSSFENRTYLLIGDIAFLHGMGGLNISAPNKNPNLTVVVLDNDGSGIFSQLEQGADKYKEHFEQVFGTPHGKDLWVVAESLGVPAIRVTTKKELNVALSRTDQAPGLQVIVCTTGERSAELDLVNTILNELNLSL